MQSPLVTTAWLEENLDDDELRIVSCAVKSCRPRNRRRITLAMKPATGSLTYPMPSSWTG